MWITSARTSDARYDPPMDDLEFADDSLPDDDVDVVVGMWRREWLNDGKPPPTPSDKGVNGG